MATARESICCNEIEPINEKLSELDVEAQCIVQPGINFQKIQNFTVLSLFSVTE